MNKIYCVFTDVFSDRFKKKTTEFSYMLILKPTQYQELPFEY